MVGALRASTWTSRHGEFVAVVGASGCGKSTLLNIVAGLDQPTAGTVSSAAERVALMFQDATLLPWLTARQNVDLALRLRGVAVRRAPRPGGRGCSTWSGSATPATAARTSSRVACASASRWPAAWPRTPSIVADGRAARRRSTR